MFKIKQVGRRYKVIRKSDNQVVQVTTSKKKAISNTINLQKEARNKPVDKLVA